MKSLESQQKVPCLTDYITKCFFFFIIIIGAHGVTS